MPRVYFIGGTSRVGKTKLAVRALDKHPMLGTSTDALRHVLRGIYEPDQLPALFAIDQSPALTIADRIERQNAESRALWPSIVRYAQGHVENGFDVLIEGIAVLPELLADFSLPYNVVFLGNTSTKHEGNILAHARSDSHDWLHHKTAAYIRNHAAFSRAFSRYIKKEAARHNMPYLETSHYSFGAMQDKALALLLA